MNYLIESSCFNFFYGESENQKQTDYLIDHLEVQEKLEEQKKEEDCSCICYYIEALNVGIAKSQIRTFWIGPRAHKKGRERTSIYKTP